MLKKAINALKSLKNNSHNSRSTRLTKELPKNIDPTELFQFLESNKCVPVYIVDKNVFLFRLENIGCSKLKVTNYIIEDPISKEPVEDEVTVEEFKKAKLMSPLDVVLTTSGAVELLEKLEPKG